MGSQRRWDCACSAATSSFLPPPPPPVLGLRSFKLFIPAHRTVFCPPAPAMVPLTSSDMTILIAFKLARSVITNHVGLPLLSRNQQGHAKSF